MTWGKRKDGQAYHKTGKKGVKSSGTRPVSDIHLKKTKKEEKPRSYDPANVRMGDRIRILNQNGQYTRFTGKTWMVDHIAHDESEHPYYDEGVSPSVLISAEGLPVSLYDWEFEIVH